MTNELENIISNYYLRKNYERNMQDLLSIALKKSNLQINEVNLCEKYNDLSDNNLHVLVNYSGEEKDEEELKTFLSTYKPTNGESFIWNPINKDKYGTNSDYLKREDEIVESLCPNINLDTKLVNDVKKDYGFLQKKGYQKKEKKKKKGIYDAFFVTDYSVNGGDDGSFLVEDDQGFYTAPKNVDHDVSSIIAKHKNNLPSSSTPSSFNNEKENLKENLQSENIDNSSSVSQSSVSSNLENNSSSRPLKAIVYKVPFLSEKGDEKEAENDSSSLSNEDKEKNEEEEENKEEENSDIDITDTGQEEKEEEDILERDSSFYEEDWSDPFDDEEGFSKEKGNDENISENMKGNKDMDDKKEMGEPTPNVISDDVKLVADEATRRYMERFGNDKDKHQALSEKTRYDMENVIDSIQKNQFPIMQAKDNVDYIVNPKDYSIYKGYNQLGLQINNALNNLDTNCYVPLKDFYNNKGIMNQKLKTCSQIITKGRDEMGNYIFEIVVPCKVSHKDKRKEKQRAKEEKRRNIFDAKFNYKYGELPIYYTELNINEKFQRPQLDKKYVKEIRTRQCDSDIEQRFNNDMANYFACMFTKEKYVPQTDWTKSKWKDELLNFAVNNPDKVVGIANSSYRDIKNKFVQVNNEMNKEKSMENSPSIYTGR